MRSSTGLLGVSLPVGFGRDLLDRGLTIGSPQPGSPAELAGLRHGDSILAVDGRPIREQDDLFLTIGAGPGRQPRDGQVFPPPPAARRGRRPPR